MQTAYGVLEYRQHDVMSASPVQLVIMAYDQAIKACHQQDKERATKAVSALRDALNFDYDEVSNGLFSLYQWCLDCIRSGEFEPALTTLSELREAWAVVQQQEASFSS